MNTITTAASTNTILAIDLGKYKSVVCILDESSGETEDHVSYLFEVMRYLIAGDDVAVCNLEQQRRFFRAHLQPWLDTLCDAVDAQPRAALWRTIAALTRAFAQVETQGFDLLEQA